MDLLRFSRIIRRRWTLILAFVLVFAAAGAASGALQPKSAPSGHYYRAAETLTQQSTESGTSSAFSLDQTGLRVTTGEVPGLVATKVGGNAADLVDRVIVASNPPLGILVIRTIGTNPEETSKLAQAFSDQLVLSLTNQLTKAYDASTQGLLSTQHALAQKEQELDAQIAANPTSPTVGDVRAERDAVANQYQLTLTRIIDHASTPVPSSPVQVLDQPHVTSITKDQYDALLDQGSRRDNFVTVDQNGVLPDTLPSSSGPNLEGPVPRGILGGLLGLFFGLGLAISLDLLDRRVRSREELEEAFASPVLAEIPQVTVPKGGGAYVVSHNAPYSRAAEGYRAVRSAVLFELALAEQQELAISGQAPGPREQAIVVMVVSGAAGEGKTTTTANLAAAFAEAGSSVLAINGDFRRPALHRQFGVPDVPGAILDTGIPGVHVVTSVEVESTATPAQVVEAQRRMIALTRRHYDILLFDTAPLLSTNDAVDVAPLTDLVLVVARYGMTKKHHARRTAELLARLRAPVGGVVFVASPTGGDDAGYSYYYGASARSAVMQSALGATGGQRIVAPSGPSTQQAIGGPADEPGPGPTEILSEDEAPASEEPGDTANGAPYASGNGNGAGHTAAETAAKQATNGRANGADNRNESVSETVIERSAFAWKPASSD